MPCFVSLLIAAVSIATIPARASGASPLAEPLCGAVAARVAALPGSGPVFLRSYEGPNGPAALDEPALRDAAFTYDNALATIALVACGRTAEATRIGDALRRAATRDRYYRDFRLRNAYRAGPVGDTSLPNGWWDEDAGRWAEDAYQVGTATGNVLWAALALFTLTDATGDAGYRDAALGSLVWVSNATGDAGGAGGFAGGFHGFEPAPARLGWKSTEHNVDAVAAFAWAHRATGEARWVDPARVARRFLDALWSEAEGRFLIGTAPDGITPAHDGSGLDAQLWPLLAVPDAPAEWRRALDWAGRVHGVQGGYDFDGDRDGLWVEGTAQAALSLRFTGRTAEADALLAELAKHVAPGGLLFATREERLTTGLAIGPDSTSADFFYFRRPHLGATAWAILAATGWNPFAGKRL